MMARPLLTIVLEGAGSLLLPACGWDVRSGSPAAIFPRHVVPLHFLAAARRGGGALLHRGRRDQGERFYR
nr:hypothetical protein [Gemmatimonadales bacterium]